MKNIFRYVSFEGMEALRDFKYVGGEYSLLDTWMNPWWLFVASLVPRWISPNAVTLIGLTPLVTSLVCLVFSHGQNDGVAAAWTYWFVFISMFWYQTMDAADGKHARMTGQSSPLGSLVDHGCDAIAVFVQCLAVELSIVNTFIISAFFFFGSVAPMITFFVCQWEFLHRGTMEHKGVTEGLLLAMSFAGCAAYFGPQFWISEINMPFPEFWALLGMNPVTRNALVLLSSVVVSSMMAIGSVFRCVRDHGVGCLVDLLPLVAHTALVGCYWSSPGFAAEGIWVRLASGTGYVVLSAMMVVSGLCKMKYPLVHFWALPFALLAICGKLDLVEIDHAACLALVTLWHTAFFLGVCADTIGSLCEFLDVPFIAAMKPRKRD